MWGPHHVPTGTGATIGIEDQAGASATRLGDNTAGVDVARTAVVLAPM